jgi:hypothetical protein
MELYHVPPNSRIRVTEAGNPPPGGIAPEVGKEYNFAHIDGMYSYCTDDYGNVVHLRAWTEVEIIDDKSKTEKLERGPATVSSR